MIAQLSGVVGGYQDGVLVVDVNGVGYRVEISTRFGSALPALGQPIKVLTETYVREDQLRLFGFPDETEREWFALLMRVPSVGAKVALAILGQFAPDVLANMLANGDAKGLAQAPGLGAKLSQRIVQELQNKVPAAVGGAPVNGNGANGATQPLADAVSALCNLGYASGEAQRVVQLVTQRDGDLASAELIRRALQELARG